MGGEGVGGVWVTRGEMNNGGVEEKGGRGVACGGTRRLMRKSDVCSLVYGGRTGMMY